MELEQSKTITKKALARALAEHSGISHNEALRIVKLFLHHVTQGLVNDKKVKLPAFGTFEIHEKSARQGRNPKTLQEFIIPQRNVIRFKPSRKLKNRLNADTILSVSL